jgi:hypothetical protein
MDFRKKITLYVVLLCLLPSISWAQYRYKKFTYFGIEAGLKGDANKMSDSGYELYQKKGFHNGFVFYQVLFQLSISSRQWY